MWNVLCFDRVKGEKRGGGWGTGDGSGVRM